MSIRSKIRTLGDRSIAYAHYIGWRMRGAFSRTGSDVGPKIQFLLGFQGRSGGSEAIVQIANLLTRFATVYLNIERTSPLNCWIHSAVKRRELPEQDTDLILCDRAFDLAKLPAAMNGVPIICSVHGMRSFLHGLSADVAQENILRADVVHFVSDYQASEFSELCRKRLVIPNFFAGVKRDGSPGKREAQSATFGMVGDFRRAEKNLTAMCDAITLLEPLKAIAWGAIDPRMRMPSNVLRAGYTTDKGRIFSSFDVFVSLSLRETFGMVVIQAMSAGLPCVLSDIPAFRDFSDCPGVTLVDPSDSAAVASALRAAIEVSPETKDAIHAWWHERYSEHAVAPRWRAALMDLAVMP
jgi:glycosyltransferase involved in cell wall biosynthesis